MAGSMWWGRCGDTGGATGFEGPGSVGELTGVDLLIGAGFLGRSDLQGFSRAHSRLNVNIFLYSGTAVSGQSRAPSDRLASRSILPYLIGTPRLIRWCGRTAAQKAAEFSSLPRARFIFFKLFIEN